MRAMTVSSNSPVGRVGSTEGEWNNNRSTYVIINKPSCVINHDEMSQQQGDRFGKWDSDRFLQLER